jgi:hypothetical protein
MRAPLGAFTIDLARISRAAERGDECGEGLRRKCGGQLEDASLTCGRACDQDDLQNMPCPIPARDKCGTGLKAVEEMFDQGGTCYVDRAIARRAD